MIFSKNSFLDFYGGNPCLEIGTFFEFLKISHFLKIFGNFFQIIFGF